MVYEADLLGLEAFLSRADAPMKRQAAFLFANTRSLDNRYLHAETAPLLAPLLADPDAAVRYAVAYFFATYAEKGHHDLKAWALQLLRLTLDNERPHRSKETVSQMARRAVSLAARVNPLPMVEATRLLVGPERSAARRILKHVLPEAVEK